MEFKNRTRENFDWYIEYDLDGLIDPDHGSHPELAAELPGVLLEEDIPRPVAAMEIEILDPNNIAAAAAANRGIKNTTGLYDDIYAPTPIFKIKSTP